MHQSPGHAQLAHRFGYHQPPNEATKKRHEHVRAVCLEAAEKIARVTPCTPEQTRALNKLHEAMMLANAAIAMNPQANYDAMQKYEPERFKRVEAAPVTVDEVDLGATDAQPADEATAAAIESAT